MLLGYLPTGEYKAIVPNKKIVFTWSSDFVSNTLATVEMMGTSFGILLSKINGGSI
jgi:uncharacterized protein YndB with AHSA1/START domain